MAVRVPWDDDFPDVIIHAPIAVVKSHEDYDAAKSGDVAAADRLARALVTPSEIRGVRALQRGASPVLISVHARESSGVNVIPIGQTMALSMALGWPTWTEVVQANIVSHTGSSGFHRMARQAEFAGAVPVGREVIMVDDFIGQGGTLANLRGHLEAHGASVIGAVSLTGKQHSARLALSRDTLELLRGRHERQLEDWWEDQFGHAFDCLTESEAGYLTRTPTADRIRARIAAAQSA